MHRGFSKWCDIIFKRLAKRIEKDLSMAKKFIR